MVFSGTVGSDYMKLGKLSEKKKANLLLIDGFSLQPLTIKMNLD